MSSNRYPPAICEVMVKLRCSYLHTILPAAIPAAAIISVVMAAGIWTSPALAQGTLKTINDPKGGKIVYGPVEGQTTTAGAMGAILRNLHNQYDDKPQVGRVFRVKGTNSDAVFFTLVKRKQNNQQIAGLVIAAHAGANRVEAALLSDDVARFGSSVNPMMKTLFGVWHPGGSTQTSSGTTFAAGASLKRYSLKDNSASVSLPEGWQVSPASGGGTIIATGPNGEAASLGFPLGAMNSNDPRVQKTMQFAQGAGRNTSYARALYYPYGGDLGRTMVDLINLSRQKKGLTSISAKIDNESSFPSSRSRCAHLTGHVDLQDGKGNRELNAIFCVGPLSRMGQYSATLFAISVPVGVADKERATMGAMLASFTTNMAVVNAEASAIAAPEIEHIHEIGRQAAQQAEQAHAANDAHNRSVEERWDEQDKSNEAFSNYLLDQTVILDNEHNAHGTVWNQTADALVKSDPNRFEYVNTPNYWKGIDY
ncbi:MAG: hypothetical protein WBZ11_02350 [Candidatus Sulfotelmatobacter sp.]